MKKEDEYAKELAATRLELDKLMKRLSDLEKLTKSKALDHLAKQLSTEAGVDEDLARQLINAGWRKF